MRGLVACLPGGWLAGWLHDILCTRTLFGPNEEILLCSSRRDARATQQASILLLINLRSALQRKITACARQPLFSLDTICERRVFDHYSHTRYCCCCPAFSGERRLCSLLLSFQKHPLIELEFTCQIKESRYLGIEFPCAPVDLHFYINQRSPFFTGLQNFATMKDENSPYEVILQVIYFFTLTWA
jgi:hypothetical protein